ncbi:erythromycin esterase family protein [Methylobacterium frigidaeris]|uniref:Erythromycin esterase n=1 Tax=Methylobacterium frigidaeris TaxID=2038277 RepID=A0AA37HHG2_9HYPH|nr:erythromycin esterase family protein [Methylobacterium frigidaeris]GJD65956.1 hypothetical protein MPEAHAMD_6152 [Methylobacterium frigidaeris]
MPEGFRIKAFATGLAHPRQVYVLPNGDVLVVEANGPNVEPVRRPKDLIMGWIKAFAGAGAGAEGGNRITYRGSVESWNIRDRHMFETLRHLMADGAKAIVWAHNWHIGHAGATAMGWEGEFNIGELARTAYGDKAVLVGFGTDRGTMAAADDWDEPMRVMDVRPVREDSHEALFREAGLPRAFLDLREPGSAALREAWTAPRRERAIGVVYRPDTELQSHYFEAVLPEQFDAYVWLEESRAVTPLPPAEIRPGESETYPTGL